MDNGDTSIVAGFDATAEGADGLELARLLTGLLGAEMVVAPVAPDGLEPHRNDRVSLWEARERLERTRRAVMTVVPGGEDLEIMPSYDPSVARALHRLAREDGADLIVIGSRHHDHGRRLTGGTAEALIARAPCPVAVAPPGFRERDPGRLTRVGVAYDGSAFADAALDLAIDLARSAGAGLTVLTAGERGVLDAGVARCAAALPGEPEAGGRLVPGEPAPALAAATADVDLLVMGTRGLGPIRRVLLGSVTAHVLHDAVCPVIVVPAAPAA